MIFTLFILTRINSSSFFNSSDVSFIFKCRMIVSLMYKSRVHGYCDISERVLKWFPFRSMLINYLIEVLISFSSIHSCINHHSFYPKFFSTFYSLFLNILSSPTFFCPCIIACNWRRISLLICAIRTDLELEMQLYFFVSCLEYLLY